MAFGVPLKRNCESKLDQHFDSTMQGAVGGGDVSEDFTCKAELKTEPGIRSIPGSVCF
jgi:hypothetical protein